MLTTEAVLALQAAADRVFVHHAIAQYAVNLVVATRLPHRYGMEAVARHLEFGASPRATLGLVAAARALALLRGRDYVLPRDIADVAGDVMAHRLVLSFDAVAEGVDPRQVIAYLLSVVPQPQIAPSRLPGRAGGRGSGMRRLADTARAFATLELTVRKRLVGLVHGEQDSPRTGAGSEPEEVVRYRPGEDDVRRIDWNVTARTGEPHVWRTLAEHEIETWVLVDETASMDFGTVDVEKGELAAWVTGVVGLLSDHPGNQMGVAHLTTGGLTWSPPLSPRRAAFRALAGLPGAPGRGRGRPLALDCPA